MSQSRPQICRSAARKLAAASAGLKGVKALIGLDGFVDEIIAVVDKRLDNARYEPIRTIAQFGERISAAAGESTNYEMIVRQMKLGGNGPIMANALAHAGLGVTYLGILGHPTIHPVFQEMAGIADCISIGEPGHTDALEFDDGKLMLGKLQPLLEMNWQNIVARCGIERLTRLITDASLVAMNNWTMLPFMSDVWSSIQQQILPNVPRADRKFFIDLADPEKHTPQDLLNALTILARFQKHADVILGLNLKEATQVLRALGIAGEADHESAIARYARAIRDRLQVHCVVIHPRRGAAAATAEESASFAGPFVQQPKISTGAGDHFNAGFCLGRIVGLSLEESLCVGTASSGYYVRTAESPTAAKLAEFVADLPDPQP